MKNENGITLIVLVVTIILMMILAYVGTTVGMNAYQQSKIYRFVTQMQLIQGKVDDIAKDPSTSSLGDAVTDTSTIEESRNETIVYIGDSSDFRQFSVDQMKSQL